MHIAISNALTRGWHGFRLFLSDFTVSGAVWLLIVFMLAIVALSAIAIEATVALYAPHRRHSRAKWTPEVANSAISAPAVEDMLE
jgi:hypothetical protein